MGYFLQTDPGVLILLVRHGRTALNDPKNPVVRGWVDEPLSDEGRNELQILAEKLKPYRPKSVISSDFMRDTETANILADRLGVASREADFDARTWDVGLYSGRPESEVNPAIARLYRQSRETPPGSNESFDGFAKRWLDFLDRKMIGTTVDAMRPALIVTHGRNIALADSYFNMKPNFEGEMPLAGSGFAEISVSPDRSISLAISGGKEPVIQDV